jgi:hypothetical protein
MPSFLRLAEDNPIVRRMLMDYQAFHDDGDLWMFASLDFDLVTALLEERVLFVALLDAPSSMRRLIDGLPYGAYSTAQAILWHYEHQSLQVRLAVEPTDFLTIDGFLKHNQHIQDTADDLFIHRNTLQYRLDRFAQKTGLNVRRFDDALAYYVVRHFCATCQ